jgi:hypothetical protein
MEFFVRTNSFAAPFFSDTGEQYVEAETAAAALEHVAATYAHTFGLYAAAAFESHKAAQQGQAPLARWLSNHARVTEERTRGLGAYSRRSMGPGVVEIDDEVIQIPDPKAGAVMP